MEDKMATCIETDDGMVMIKFAIDQSCKIYLEKIVIPEDKERVIKQIALEGNIDLALEMANKLDDPSIASNIRLRNGWEHSNRTVQDIDMLLKKIKDPEYIVQQCISNATPNKDILKGDAIEFVDVQRHLIKTGLDALMDTDNHIPNANRFVNQLLLKEERLTKYEIVLNAFKDDSENVIIDWESFSGLQYMEMIEYINSICLIEETPIDKIVLSLKEIDRALFREHYLDILRTIDTSLMNDSFLVNVLPQGDRPSEDVNQSTDDGEENKFDPIPYQIVAKRIFLEEIKPSKAYFLFLTGLKRGIKELDFDTISSYEISKLFSIRRKEKTLSSNYDLKELMSFNTSYERFCYLMNTEDFLEGYFKCMKEIVTLTEDERVYHNHYLTHMKAFLDGDHDLEFLQTLIDKMCASELFLDPIDG